jgi:signal transduction histidine kinase
VLDVRDLRPIRLFEGLTDDQLAQLAAAGGEERIKVGVELFREGDPADWWWVLVDGAVELSRHVGRDSMVVGRMDRPGQWAGGFRAWDEHGVYLATGVGVRRGRLLRVPAHRLREHTDSWFPLGGHLIAGLFTTARSIEATARQRESLVTLGRLAAGLAHELNNPAAAAGRAVDALESAAQGLQGSLERLAAGGVTAEQFLALTRLRQQVAPPAGLDPLRLADREEALISWLDAHGIARSWLLAPALAVVGVDETWCEAAGAVLGQSALEPALEWVASSLALAGLLGELKQSTRHISDIVGAMKSYSQMDRASAQRVDLTEGLDKTLVVLGDKIPDTVLVVRDYGDDVPVIEAYPGELNQVWTNLVDNAVEAMHGAGTLRVSTRTDGQDVIVEITDSGPGMTPAVAARAFEAFFTTKSADGKSGLGLDVARRIVEERHGGTIGIDSRPGRTVVRVRLKTRLAPGGR